MWGKEESRMVYIVCYLFVLKRREKRNIYAGPRLKINRKAMAGDPIGRGGEQYRGGWTPGEQEVSSGKEISHHMLF